MVEIAIFGATIQFPNMVQNVKNQFGGLTREIIGVQECFDSRSFMKCSELSVYQIG